MSQIKRSIVACPHCGGAGKVSIVDPASLRKARISRDKSLRKLASELGYTAPYLSDIERGRRNVTRDIEKAYSKL